MIVGVGVRVLVLVGVGDGPAVGVLVGVVAAEPILISHNCPSFYLELLLLSTLRLTI